MKSFILQRANSKSQDGSAISQDTLSGLKVPPGHRRRVQAAFQGGVMTRDRRVKWQRSLDAAGEWQADQGPDSRRTLELSPAAAHRWSMTGKGTALSNHDPNRSPPDRFGRGDNRPAIACYEVAWRCFNDNTGFRLAANLWWVKQLLQERLVTDLGARTADCHIIDGFPITMCNPARASRSRVLKYGYCAAKEEHYCGLKANLLIDLRRIVVGITLPAAHVDERESAYDLVSVIAGLLLGDKGFSRPPFNVDGDVLGIDLQTSLCKNMIERRPRGWLPLLQRLRQRVEAMISQREQRVGLAKTRTHDVWHLTYQVTQKLLAHTLGIWLNLHQGREPLELDSLVAA